MAPKMFQTIPPWGAIASIGIFVLASSGCEVQPVLVPAAGVLKIDGQPAANITLQFLPHSLQGTRGPTSYGSTNAVGEFFLQTHHGQLGAVEGMHTVMLADQEEERPAQGQRSTKPPRIPTKYATVSSPLSVTVQHGLPITLDISSR